MSANPRDAATTDVSGRAVSAMPDDHECDFPDTCPVCRGPVRNDPEPVTVEARFPARFPGDCPSCHLAIHEGQTIAKLSNGRYVHDHCTED